MDRESDGWQPGVWAQPRTLASGETLYQELGQVRLWITLLDLEWQVRVQSDSQEKTASDWMTKTTHVLPGPEVPLQRFIRPAQDDGMVTFLPALADRPTVIRPFQPLTIPAGQHCVIYVGTMVWMQICVGAGRTLLTEVPLSPPLMTWLGRNTMEGELCYTSSTFARLVLGAVPKRPWRALTPVTLVNRRQEPLHLERFSLPTPLLPVYLNEQHQLWTPGVTVEVETGMNSASLRVERGLHREAGPCSLAAQAREKVSRGGRLVRAFDRMFG